MCIRDSLWGASVSASTVSNLSDKAFEAVEEWRSRPLTRKYPYVFVDGIYLKRSWGGSFENVAVMVAIGVNEDVYKRQGIACGKPRCKGRGCKRVPDAEDVYKRQVHAPCHT